MSVVSQSARARPQARKKVNDDASYFGPPSSLAGMKRQAADRDRDSVDGERVRVKRKRIEPPPPHTIYGDDPRQHVSLVEFDKLSLPTLYRYLTQFDIIPSINPSPLRADDPPPPSSLADPKNFRTPSPALPSLMLQLGKRRSSRLYDDENDTPTRMPVLSDIDELHTTLASIADMHFREVLSINGREEVDTLASFMCAIEKAKGGRRVL